MQAILYAIHMQLFYREMFGFKEGGFPVTENAGRTSVAYRFAIG